MLFGGALVRLKLPGKFIFRVIIKGNPGECSFSAIHRAPPPSRS